MPCKPIKKGKRLIDFKDDLGLNKSLPTDEDVLQRIKTLQSINNGKKMKIIIGLLTTELINCWVKQDMPVQARSNISRKVINLIKKKSYSSELFDILPSNPSFKCNEDKYYYESQTQGIGYSTSKQVPYNIHPSKKIKSKEQKSATSTKSDHESDISKTSNETSEFETFAIPKSYASTELCAKIRHYANLSLSQTVKVFEILFKETGDNMFLIPDKSSILKACNRESLKFYRTPIVYKDRILRFDGKTYSNLYGSKRHLMAICFNDKLLALREISNKTANCVSNVILDVLNVYNLSPRICISDTEPTNTGKYNGVFVQLLKVFPSLMFEPCRLHVLDLILKHEISVYFNDSACSPNIPWPFIKKLHLNWKHYKEEYKKISNIEVPSGYCNDLPTVEARRGDYRLLLDLVIALKYSRQYNLFPIINLPNNPPSICQSRWNSRAIYTIMAEMLSISDENIHNINTFIIEIWAKAWFGVRDYIDWNELMNYQISEKSKNVIEKNITNYFDSNPYTNEIAENVFRMIEEKINHCKSMETLENAMIHYFNDKTARLN